MRRRVRGTNSSKQPNKKKKMSKKNMKKYLESEARKARLQNKYGKYRWWY